MADVFLTSAAPPNDPDHSHPYDELRRMERSAECDQFGVHSTVSDPSSADIILYVESEFYNPIEQYNKASKDKNHFENLDKIFIFSTYNKPLAILPGIYANIKKEYFDKKRVRSGFYHRVFDHRHIPDYEEYVEKEYLYSFVGNVSTHQIRKRIFEIDRSPNSILVDTSRYAPYGNLDSESWEELTNRYVEICQQSHFVLCPRGDAVSSIRLFECMRMGCAPVIISDQWVPPEGPNWEDFSIRIDEENVKNIPKILSEKVHKSNKMGKKARKNWEKWFSKKSTFHRVVEWCIDIRRERELPERLLRLSVLPQLLEPTYFKMFVRGILPREAHENAKSIWNNLKRVL